MFTFFKGLSNGLESDLGFERFALLMKVVCFPRRCACEPLQVAGILFFESEATQKNRDTRHNAFPVVDLNATVDL
jgi:hypothetical protein